MKRISAIILAAMLALAALTGCADTGLYGYSGYGDRPGNVSTTDNGRVNGRGYATTAPRRSASRTVKRAARTAERAVDSAVR